jgi:hypothetical protein
MGHSRTSARRVNQAFNRRLATELRLQGLSYRQIAARLGISEGTAYKHVVSALNLWNATMPETVEQLRTIEAARLDRLQAKYQPLAEDGSAAAAALVLKISERRSRLFGLDLADKQTAAVTGNLILNVHEMIVNKVEALPNGSGTSVIIDGSSAVASSPAALPA